MLRFAQHDIDEVRRIATQSLTELGEVYLPRNYMLRAAANASTIDVVNFGFLINRKSKMLRLSPPLGAWRENRR
jgi:hypothetical protein